MGHTLAAVLTISLVAMLAATSAPAECAVHEVKPGKGRAGGGGPGRP